MVKPLTNIAESEIPIQLLNDIRHGKVYAFIGSGLSINIGYPSWSQLVTEIYNHHPI